MRCPTYNKKITRHTKSKKGNNPLSRNKVNNITRIRQTQISEISSRQFKIIVIYAKGSHGKTAEQMGNFSRDRNYKNQIEILENQNMVTEMK